MKQTYAQLLRKSPGAMIFGANQFFFSAMGQAFLLSMFVPQFIELSGMDQKGVSYIYTAAALVSGFLLSFVGPMVDRYDIRKFAYFSGFGGALFCILMANVHNPWMLLFGILGLRFCGQAMMPFISMTAMGKHFGPNRGKALSFSMLGLSFAEMLIPGIIVGALKICDWKTLWYGIAMIEGIAFPLITYLLVGRIPDFCKVQNTASKADNKTFIKQLFRNPVFLLMATIFAFSAFLNAGFLLNHNLVLEARNWSLEWYALAFATFGVGRIVGSFSSGPLVDKFSARTLAPFALLPLSVAVAIISLIPNQWSLPIFLFILAGSLSISNVVGTALWAELFGVDRVGTCRGLGSSFLAIATALAPTIFVFLYSWDFQNAMLIILAVQVVLSCGAYYLLRAKEKVVVA
ncbi:MFS transporter [Persicobacter psychrovividus]|uniref:MFS transporter n=1 Tax=Persicobacter psychrovividus TaxID=387638 RepID=A0ABN6LA70_9BACT|nr:MFS transporter [Persicobacter psychrovividus]